MQKQNQIKSNTETGEGEEPRIMKPIIKPQKSRKIKLKERQTSILRMWGLSASFRQSELVRN